MKAMRRSMILMLCGKCGLMNLVSVRFVIGSRAVCAVALKKLVISSLSSSTGTKSSEYMDVFRMVGS